uniref:hypothetical protein n=1 Tax=uncultured Draconibacterium sp. TaxID=1573823 RepID=UPI0032162AFD
MAGTLLLIKKKNTGDREFSGKKDLLKKYIQKEFSDFFHGIHFHEADPNSFLVEFRKNDESKYFQDSKGNWLTYEGTVFALKETKVYNAKQLLELYLINGENFVNELDGHFVIKLYDKSKNKHLVITDFIRSRINYLTETDDLILFTPFVLPASVIREIKPDLDALNEIFWRYYILSSRSIFEDVSRLDSATIYRVKNNTPEKSVYWNYPSSITDRSFDESVNLFVESIKETARLINMKFGKAAMDLTQGQDSRIIMAAFRSQNLPFSTTTFGKEEFEELKNVKKIAEKHNFEHHTIELTQAYTDNIDSYYRKSLVLGNGDEPGYLLGRILFMRDQQSQFGNVLVNGTGGPFYKDCFWEEIYALDLYRERYKIDHERFLKLRPMNKDYQSDIFTGKFLKIKEKSRAYFINMLKDSIDNLEGQPASLQIDKFALTKWQNYAVIGNNIALSTQNSIAPLLLRRNLEIGLPMPAKWRWNKSNFQRAVMYKLDPKLAREKTDFGGISMVPYNALTFVPFYIKYVLRQTQRYRNKLLNKLGLNVKTHLQAAWDYKPIYEMLFKSKEIQELLPYNALKLSDAIQKDKWEEFLNKFSREEDITLNDYEFLFKIAGTERLLKLGKKNEEL